MLCLSFREFTALTEVLQGDVVQLVNIREFTALTEVLQGDVVQLVNAVARILSLHLKAAFLLQRQGSSTHAICILVFHTLTPRCGFGADTMTEPFPIDLKKYEEVELDLWKHETLPAHLKAKLAANVELCSDSIVFFTACGSA